MDKRYRVSGIFILNVEGKNKQEARAKSHRILCADGIEHYFMEIDELKTDEVKTDEQEQKSIQI